MALKTLDQADLTNKTVLVRVDFNVPIQNGNVADTSRIEAVKPTIEYLLQHNCKIILCSHLGRPEGNKNPEFSLKQIVSSASKILGHPIGFCAEPQTELVKNALVKNQIILLENTRYYPGEEANDKTFAQQLASLANVYVNDAFGASHRAHASTEGVTKFLPSYAGKLVEAEINALSKIREGSPKPPFTFVIGGAKIDTKIGILKNFIDKADNILIGGALANTFLAAAGFNVAESKVETDKTAIAQEIMLLAEKHHGRLLIPVDVIVADEVSNTTLTINIPVEDVLGNMKILDIGNKTIETYSEIIKNSATVVWNGPMGLYELEPFQNGTKMIAEAIANSPCKSYVGGGDSVDALAKLNVDQTKFTHISTGGGAMIEYIEGNKMPGLEPLMD
ncbi:phosphoglycerate kinase [Candidatus Peregrinibacteria bacterium CG11_big_fil_rev_8_21_14_0_20_41_10]|nr:MAG: phosphoglycerate kinase [Candidatus Peregrinibacteria bacterium CG11_big_fil_rev_8_21_14_0_20_41_10]PJC38011.1 MAG: phosphoglycerate kinase [Candidatus Peregrinibacteria bacterium CG_4_9_14_0_2_um_filter_41_14]